MEKREKPTKRLFLWVKVQQGATSSLVKFLNSMLSVRCILWTGQVQCITPFAAFERWRRLNIAYALPLLALVHSFIIIASQFAFALFLYLHSSTHVEFEFYGIVCSN